MVDENPSRAGSRIRELGKWLLWRTLPRRSYQKVLARSKAADFESQAFREPELDLVPLAVAPGDTAVDVGANHGMWTRVMSQAAGPEGNVISFEPVPFTFGTLEALVDHLSLANVELVNAGCSDRAGTFEMVVPSQGSGASDDLQAHLATRGDSDGESVQCEIVRLDEALAGIDEIDLIKLDIEGAELDALRGGINTLERHRPAVICEVDRDFLAGFGHRSDELDGLLGELGYSPWHYRGDTQVLEPLESLETIQHANVVFLTDERRERFVSVIE